MMQRHVHVFTGPDLLATEWEWDTATRCNVACGTKLEKLINRKLVNGERIVGTHKDSDNRWVIITENLGLGPAKKP